MKKEVKKPTPQQDMLAFCLGIVTGLEECSLEKAFIKLLDYAALKLSVDTSVMVSLKADTFELLKECFNIELLRQEPRDWFGELYDGLVECKSIKGSLIPVAIECTHDIDCDEITFPKTVLFKKFNTGRDTIEMFKKYGDKIIYYGMQSDLLMYRIALVNINLFNIPAFVLCTNEELAKDKDFKLSSPNWLYSNFWIPLKEHMLI